MRLGPRRKFKTGETIPSNYCPNRCGYRKGGRSALGTCGHQDCIAAENKRATEGANEDNRDPSRNMKIKVGSKTYTVKHSKTVRGKLAYVTKEGHTFPASGVKELD